MVAIKLLALAALALITSGALGATVQELTTGIKNESKGVFDSFAVSADYRGSTDLNAKETPRAYEHEIGLSVSREFFEKYTGTLSAGMDFASLGADVSRETSQDDYFNFSDIGVSVFRSAPLNDGINSVAGILSTDILVSEESRYRGYRGVGSGQGILTTTLRPWLSLKNSIGASYILNRYRFSPVTSGKTQRGDINPDGFYSYRFSPILRIVKGLYFIPAVSVRGTHFMDNTNTYDFGNSYTLSYSVKTWSTYLKYINSGYADRGETNVWFVDKYRSLLELGLTYNF